MSKVIENVDGSEVSLLQDTYIVHCGDSKVGKDQSKDSSSDCGGSYGYEEVSDKVCL